MNHFTNQSNGSYRGHSLMGRAMLRRFALFFPMILLMLLFLPARMVAQKAASSSKYIAMYDPESATLTFEKYEGESLPSESESEWVEDGKSVFEMFGSSYLRDIKHIVINESFKTFTPTTLSSFFAALSELETITGLEYLNTANVTDMSSLFDHCQKLTSLDLSNFNTAKVTNMNRMFSNCSNLKTIYASDKFTTAAVTESKNMFSYCGSLSGDIDWTSDKATDKTYAKTGGGYFRDKAYDNRPYVKYADGTLTFRCGYKKILGENEYELNSGEKLPKWNTHNSKISKVVFEASFANARPTTCYAWFKNFTFLNQIEGIENLNTANVTNMSYMFKGCSNLAVLDVTHFNTAKVTIMSHMFKGCSNLAVLDVTHFNTAKVTIMSYMFKGCSNLAELDVTHFNTAKVTTMDSMFSGCSNLAELDVTHFNTANVTNMYEMFNGCSNLVKLDVTHFNTAEVTDMSYMFYDCSNLAELDVTHFNTAKVTIMNGMFSGCSNLTELDLTHFNTANVTNMYVMFSGCKSLTTIYVSDEFVITNITNKSYSLFSGCTKLKGAIDFDASKTNYKFANYKTGYFTKLVGKNGDEKIGATGETLATDNLVLDDDKDFVAYEPFAAKAASYNRTMNAGTTWATLCLPFEVSLANQNFRAFKLLSADEGTETVELEEIEGSIAAGTPVIIKMKDGATKLDFTVANKEIAKDVQTAETANGNYQLQGLYTQKMFSKDTDNNCYIVKGAKLMNPAKLLDKTTTESVGSKPFRAYMVDNSSASAPAAGARMLSISVGGSTTAIEQLETTADSKAEYYDLQGRRLQNLQKGVNIVKRGGKTMKVIIK
ncbi:BspA family leucine-rich repeat surface protein [Segatella copri]|uniref:BspA family leucine-rich repeat surface protein n=1 Tax=Segatella copri TaxID=165179 RepID=UPI003F6F033B